MNRFAAIQMASSPNVEANLIEAERLIHAAADAGARLVVLPENFAFMGMHELDKLQIRENPGEGPIQDMLARAARACGVWIVGGTLPMRCADESRIRACCPIYNDQGQQVARYDKIHLFDVDVPETDEVYRESDSIEAGDSPLVLDTPFGRLGVVICYDLRFPELTRLMAQQGGMDVLAVPAAFTAQTGAAHWELLIRARAVENLCYVIASNQGGFHLNGRNTYGHSMIVDPWGGVLDQLPSGAGAALADADPARLGKIRSSFPVLNHRRINCGGETL